LMSAILLQALLKLTVIVSRNVVALLNGRSGAGWTLLKYLTAWAILLGSKSVILEVLSFAFGQDIRFLGALDGAVWLTLVVFTMVIAEDLMAKFYRQSLERRPAPTSLLPVEPLRNYAE